MASPILVTKLFLPKPRQELVARPLLVERLMEGVHQKMTLVSAPAGFGKTTLITEWISHLNETYKACWYALDASDNDPVQFLCYLLSALQTVSPDVGKDTLLALQSAYPPAPSAALTDVINQLAASQEAIVLVLDDYHLIDNQEIHDALTFLIENMPPRFHLVLVTREDPVLPMARLRVRGQLSEIRASDLRFRSQEAVQFMQQVMHLDLSIEEIAALEKRTEGWIAGLQLAGLSLKGSVDQPGVLHSFVGSNRLVLDYLVEEVLHQQPQYIQDFLLQTAVLERFCPALCEAVLQSEPAAVNASSAWQILARLERANLFIVPLDHGHEWYRYHHLFADLLCQRLRQLRPEKVAGLYLRASCWFEDNGFMNESVEYALSGGLYQRAGELISREADLTRSTGEHEKLWHWLIQLPEECLLEDPHLNLLYGWNLFSRGQHQKAEDALQIAEESIEKLELQPETESEVVNMYRGILAATRAMMDTWHEDAPNMMKHAREALALLPTKDPWYGPILTALGDAYYFQGDIQSSYHTRSAAVESCLNSGDIFYYLVSKLKVATSLREMGELHRSNQLCEEVLEYVKDNHMLQPLVVGWLYTLWGENLINQNQLEQGADCIDKGIAYTTGKDLSFYGFSKLSLLRLSFYQHDYTRAQEILEELQLLNRNKWFPQYMVHIMIYWQVRMLLLYGETGRVLELFNAPGKANLDDDHTLFEPLALARVLIAQEEFEKAHQQLARFEEKAFANEHVNRLIEIYVLQALLYDAQHKQQQSRDALSRAVQFAEPGGFVSVFLVEGKPMARLLYQLLPFTDSPDYVQSLLAEFSAKETVPQESENTPDDTAEYIEPLSEREFDVLQLLANGLSNQEIAARLYLSLNTVKAHTRNIYNKLNVNNRTQAAAKARNLGLMTSEDN